VASGGAEVLASRWFRRVIVGLLLYLAVCVVGGIYVADATLRPPRRPLSEDDAASARSFAAAHNATLEDASITTSDGAVLRAWEFHPHSGSGNAVIVFHGLGDNRLGMAGYAELFLAHGLVVLLPDARAHGVSGGALATFGLLERNDIRQWADFLAGHDRPRCIYGLGESMGAAELLQSLAAGVHFCAVVAESSFSNFREIAYDRMGQPFHLGPWVGRTVLRPLVEIAFLRARWKYGLDMNRASPEDAIAATTIPVLLIHGQVDSNIPVRHSRQMHALVPRVELWEVPGADHCGAMSTAPEEFERRVVEWFSIGR
jgi:uncharacterized protein